MCDLEPFSEIWSQLAKPNQGQHANVTYNQLISFDSSFLKSSREMVAIFGMGCANHSM